jgi:hypothetical protein
MICLIAQRGGRMPISCTVASITLDELAVELLPAQVVIAIDEVDIEYLLWEAMAPTLTYLTPAG